MARMARVVIPDHAKPCSSDDNKNTELIKQQTRTGRPLGSTEFIRELEISTGEELAPKRPGRKPYNDKQVYCPRIPAGVALIVSPLFPFPIRLLTC